MHLVIELHACYVFRRLTGDGRGSCARHLLEARAGTNPLCFLSCH